MNRAIFQPPLDGFVNGALAVIPQKIYALFVSLAVVLFGTGCSPLALGGSQPTSTSAPVPTFTPDVVFQVTQTAEAQVAILNANFRKWQAQNISHYRFTVNIESMCAEGTSTIEVKNGEAIAIVAGDGAGVAPADFPMQLTNSLPPIDQYMNCLKPYMTIDGMFEAARDIDTSMQEVGDFDGEYDLTLGYPILMDIGVIETDSTGVRVTDFQKLP